MKKNIRRLKNLFRKFTVFSVVFVALVNTCFYCPEVYAADVGGAETLLSISSPSSSTIFGACVSGCKQGQINGVNLSNDDTLRLNLDFTVADLSTSFDDGDYFEYVVDLFIFGYSGSDNSHIDNTVYVNTFEVWNPSVSGGYDNPNISFSSDYTRSYFSNGTTGFRRRFLVSGTYSKMYSLHFNFDINLHYWGPNVNDLVNLFCLIETQSLIVRDSSSVYGDVLDRIEGNTENTTDAVTDGFNQAMNGYDDSAGSQAASDLDNSASGYESAEDSIFTSSKSSLEGFEFFDFNSIPAVVTGLSFITTTATAIFDAMGGASGAGIVLSVLFAVMFVSIVIGLYRYFK